MAECGNWSGFTGQASSWDQFNECEAPPTVIEALPDRVNQEDDVGGFATAQAFDQGSGASLVYSATGLPSGASIDPATGFVTYNLDTPGTGPVSVTLTTEYGAATDTFNWTVTPAAVTTDAWATESGFRWITEDQPGDWLLETQP